MSANTDYAEALDIVNWEHLISAIKYLKISQCLIQTQNMDFTDNTSNNSNQRYSSEIFLEYKSMKFNISKVYLATKINTHFAYICADKAIKRRIISTKMFKIQIKSKAKNFYKLFAFTSNHFIFVYKKRFP